MGKHHGQSGWRNILMGTSMLILAECSLQGSAVAQENPAHITAPVIRESKVYRDEIATLPSRSTSAMKVVNVREFGAVPDNKTDNTKSIQRAIDALPAAGGVCYFPAGADAYLISDRINIEGRTNVHLVSDSSNRAKIRMTAVGKTLLSLRSSVKCSIRDLHLVGTGMKYPKTEENGIYIGLCERCVIAGNIVEHMSSNGVRINRSRHTLIFGNTISNTATFNGLGGTGGEGNVWDSNLSHDNFDQGIELRGQSHATVTHNVCYNNGGNGINEAGITIEVEDRPANKDSIPTFTEGALVADNKVYSNVRFGIFLSAVNKATIDSCWVINNESFGNKKDGIYITNAEGDKIKAITNVVIMANNSHDNGANGLRAYFPSRLVVLNNEFTGNVKAAVRTESGDGISVIGNTFRLNKEGTIVTLPKGAVIVAQDNKTLAE